jgi:hypothetical protein
MSFSSQYRVFIVIAILIVALVLASPVISEYMVPPQTEYLTELSILGPYRNATYPFNLTSGDVYPLYLTVTNRLGESAQYQIQVKFRTPTQSAPNSFTQTPSSLPPLCDFTFFVEDKESYELPIDISFIYQKTFGREAELNELVVNDNPVDANSVRVAWDSRNDAYLGNLFFELYLYNDEAGSFEYHERYVSLWVNLR